MSRKSVRTERLAVASEPMSTEGGAGPKQNDSTRAYGATLSQEQFRCDAVRAVETARTSGAVTILDASGAPRAVVSFPKAPKFDE